MKQHLWDGDTFEHNGREYKVTFPREDCQETPWDWADGHGPVSEWTTRDKLPGERVLAEDRRSKRYYDICEATKIAKRDGWGLSDEDTTKLAKALGRKPTRKEIAAQAVENDFEFLRGRCNDDWTYVTVMVEHVESGEMDCLGMVESSSHDYLGEVARECADEIASRLDDEMAQEIQEASHLEARVSLYS